MIKVVPYFRPEHQKNIDDLTLLIDNHLQNVLKNGGTVEEALSSSQHHTYLGQIAKYYRLSTQLKVVLDL